MLGGKFWVDVLIKKVPFVETLVCIVAAIVVGIMSFAFRVSRRMSFIVHRPLTFSTYQRRITKDVIGLMSYTCITSLVSSSTKVCCASIVAFCLVRHTPRVA